MQKKKFSKSKAPNRDDRLPIVANLYKVGLVTDEIGFLLSLSSATIRSDISNIKDETLFEDRPSSKQAIFKRVLYEYAWIMVERMDNRWNNHLELLEIYLSQWLGIDQILLILKALGEKLISIQPDKPENQGYANLLYEIFPQIASMEKRACLNFWRQYLRDIVLKAVKTPSSYEELAEQLAELGCASWRPHIPPAWSARITEIIDGWLLMLEPRQITIVKKYFGLGTTPCTLKVIADQENVTFERIRQVKNDSIKILRGRIDEREISLFLQPSYLVGESFVLTESREKERILNSNITILKIDPKKAARFAKARIERVRDLIARTEKELLIIRGIGKVTTNFVKKELAVYNLEFKKPEKKEAKKKPKTDETLILYRQGLPRKIARKLHKNGIDNIEALSNQSYGHLRLFITEANILIIQEFLAKKGKSL